MDDPEQMEEERRLCYVGVTRAKDRLCLLHTFRRTLYGESEVREPSRYLRDIPPHLLRGWRDKKPARQPSLGLEHGRFLGHTPARAVPSHASPEARGEEGSSGLPQPRASAPQPPAERNRPEVRRFQTGDEVEHGVFGRGVVIESKLVGGDEEVMVAFPGVGLKRLLASMAPMEKVEKG
jgi:DNA helicase-2/ATP-dependent DNA helicase PcrA